MGFKHFRNNDHKKNVEARRNYFKIGSDLCKYLACGWNPVIKIGEYLFCHGGISLNISQKYKIEDINQIMRDTLYGNKIHLHKPYFNELFLDNDSILWNRTYSIDLYPNKEHYESNILTKILKNYNVKYMVLGHTPNPMGIKNRFNGRVFCIDTAMSNAFSKKVNNLERIHFLKILPFKNEVAIY
jgi:hypothetical protein